jgi:hypothetical protein
MSDRKRALKLGISSYTENELVLDVIGNTNIGGDVTIGNIAISPSGIITSSNPGISTPVYYGDGSNLFGVSAFNVVTQEATGDPVYPTFASNIGVSEVGIASDFVYLPSTGYIGIGTTYPTSKLTVVGDGLFTGIVTASNFVGSGIGLTGVRIGIQSAGIFVGDANTINFTGVGATFITVSSGIATVNIPGLVKTYNYYIATEGQTIFPSFYNSESVEIYMNGVKLSHPSYDASTGTEIVLNEGATQNDEIEIIGYYAYNFFNSYANYAENLIGTPNLNLGVVSAVSYYGDGSHLTGVTTSLLNLNDVDATTLADNKYLKYNQSTDKFEFSYLNINSFALDIDGGVSSTVYEPLEFIVADGGNASTNYFPTDLIIGGGGA